VRALAIMAMTVGVLLGGAGPGLAHVGLVPGEISPDAPAEAQIVLAHGCGQDGAIPEDEDDAAATSAVTVEVPAPLRVTPQEVEGWTLTVEDGAGADRLRWDHDADEGADGTVFLDVVVDAADVAPGDQLWVPVRQDCIDGSTMSWDHPGAAVTVRDLPAMSFRAATATVDPTAATGLPTPVLVSLVIALAVVAGGVAVAVTGRRTG
jgi:uncharacterized protein YcnI